MSKILTMPQNNDRDYPYTLADCMQNRDISWLKFNKRVLEESNFIANPLLERLKFIYIFANNLDEFFMVRVGSLTDLKLYAPEYIDNKTGMTAAEQLEEIFRQTVQLYATMEMHFFTLMQEISRYDIVHLKMHKLSQHDEKLLERHFIKNIMPLLSPQIIGKLHPFPHLENKRLHIATKLEQKGTILYGLIPIPKTLLRMFFLEDTLKFVLLEDIIYHFSHLAFSPYKLTEKTVLAVTRNSDIDSKEARIIDEEDLDYTVFMGRLLKLRQRLAPVRLEIQYQIGKPFKSYLLKKLKLKENEVFITAVPLDLSYCFSIGQSLTSEMKDKLLRPFHIPNNIYNGKSLNLIQLVKQKDILLHYPYESILPFLRMLSQAADDESVISIKITLYRLDFKSRLADSLMRAAENGKEVIVMMELRARFDEENNINWSKQLEEAGCTVVFGLENYKVHSKICLITKREADEIIHITQIGTGNYNEKTAKLYTDFCLMTADSEIGSDASEFFKNILLGNMGQNYKKLWVAPNFFKQNVLKYIDEEIEKASKGIESQIIIKCNSLTDKAVILKLIQASKSGVKIYMIVRSSCCVVPQIPNYTHNITVISIVGSFLEHTRIYCFGMPQNGEIFISSADLMTRNTERRVEVACPILDKDIKQEIYETLKIMISDNTKAWEQMSDKSYILRQPGNSIPVNSQEILLKKANEKANIILNETEEAEVKAMYTSATLQASTIRKIFIGIVNKIFRKK